MPHDIGWAAGFFEGEGCIRVQWQRGTPTLRISIAQVYREPLDKFKEIFDAGAVTGPYGPYTGNRQPHYQYNMSGQPAIDIAIKMLPYLFRKGEQVKAAIAEFEEYKYACKAA